MALRCAVDGCLSSEKDEDLLRKFHRFPLDEVRCRQWIRAASRNDLLSKNVSELHESYRICNVHFAPFDHFNGRLKTNAVPTLNLPKGFNIERVKFRHADPRLDPQTAAQTVTQTQVIIDPQTNTKMKIKNNHIIYHQIKAEINDQLSGKQVRPVTRIDKSTQTVQELINNIPKVKKLRNQLNCKKREVRHLSEQLDCQRKRADEIETSLSPVVKKLINNQKHFKLRSRGQRYDFDYKMFAMNIYSASPLAYRIIAKTLNMPSERTLRRCNIAIGTTLTDTVVKCLQAKVDKLTDTDKVCVLCADEMPVKKHLHKITKEKVIGYHEVNGVPKTVHATRAILVMVRGLFSKWRQPVAYCFLSDNLDLQELNMWLDNIIIKISGIGCNVVAFTSGFRNDFISLAESRNVTLTNPFFYVNGRKIYHLFDVPQLLNALRKNFINYDFVYHLNEKEETARWDDIVKVYGIDNEGNNKLGLKLKEAHIKPANTENKVKYAAQVFSKSVATAIQSCVAAGQLPNEALSTAYILQLINDAFDVLNSSPLCADKHKYKYKTAFSQQDYQMEALHNMLWFLNNVRLMQKSPGNIVTNTQNCLPSFSTTIQSIVLLSTDLKNQSFYAIFTRRLHRDILDIFFRTLKQQGPTVQKPTSYQFAQGFKILFLTSSNS